MGLKPQSIKVAILKIILCRRGNQWRSRKTREMWSYFLAPVMNLAAAFCTLCKRRRRSSLTPYNRLLQNTSRPPTNACANVLAASVVNELLMDRSCLNWEKHERQVAVTWSRVVSLTVKMNSEIGHRGWKIDVSRLELLDVDFGQLLSWSNPYHSIASSLRSSWVCCSSSMIKFSPCSWQTVEQLSAHSRLQFWDGLVYHRHTSEPSRPPSALLDDSQQFCRVQKE